MWVGTTLSKTTWAELPEGALHAVYYIFILLYFFFFKYINKECTNFKLKSLVPDLSPASNPQLRK